tara:strand:+ start:619 stop:1068 length:450 start_codon:yes stop_codon:yes gene_type:complete
MRILLFILSISTIAFSQIPENSDSIYYSPKYCDTADSVEQAMNSWIFSSNVGNCINPSEGMLNALWPGLAIFDTYDCCCKVASTPSLPGSWTGFEGSICAEYLNSIDFLSVKEDVIKVNGIYYDMQGRAYKTIPRGVSFMNYNKYFNIQ